MNNENLIIDDGEKTKIVIEHRLGVMKAGRFIWLLIISLSIWGIYSEQYHLILIALSVGWFSMFLLSIHAANKVKELTGMSHSTQAELWSYYKGNLN
jgi:hypothetical protein